MSVVEIKSIFGIEPEIVFDYIRGDCFLFAYYLYKRLRENKIKVNIIETYDKRDDRYIHTLLSFKSRYIDILGIHTKPELLQNHYILYDIPPYDLDTQKVARNEFERIAISNHKIENPKHWKSAKRYADRVFESLQFQSFLEN